MIISGLQNTTLLDYPGLVAATLFLGGCNFRCPFCHNPSIVMESEPFMSLDKFRSFLKKRRGLIDGVCITGGEPSINADLPDIMSEIKSYGLKVKLDTNGSNPQMIEKVISNGLVDYIAMDIKSSLSGYGKAVGIENFDTAIIEESIRIIMDANMDANMDYEFRTTLVKGIHTYNDMDEIIKLIWGAKAYYLQSYKDNELTIEKIVNKNDYDNKCQSFTKNELEEFLKIARIGVPGAILRGVD